ncbi:MAG: SRPBCC family protein [Chloroflexi bacterium]|nr:SRPBCC family protein [Chloroflexota bacterium]MCC6895152.1 SRPBCC family protein [Anaerolineae bacterium]
MTQQNEANPLAIHIPQNDRNLSLVGGGLLTLIGVAFGLARRNPFGALLAAIGGTLIYRSMTGRSEVYYLMSSSSSTMSEAERVIALPPKEQRQHVTAVITVDYPAEKLYHIWRDFQQVPRILSSIESVTVVDRINSHWTAKPVDGFKMSWDVEIISEVPNKVIRWQSIGDAKIANAGSVHFRPALTTRGTEMRVTLEYAVPEPDTGVNVARWLGVEADNHLQGDLEAFKANVEQGRFEPPYEPWVQPDDGQFYANDTTGRDEHRHPIDGQDIENVNRNM